MTFADPDSWIVWMPTRKKWVVLSTEIEAHAFAEKFGGTAVRRAVDA